MLLYQVVYLTGVVSSGSEELGLVGVLQVTHVEGTGVQVVGVLTPVVVVVVEGLLGVAEVSVLGKHLVL